MRPAALVVALALVPAACDDSGTDHREGAAPLFRDATDASGIRFRHDCGSTGSYFMPQVMGAGCAFLDHDRDGDLDVYLVNGGEPPGSAREGPPPRNVLLRQEPGLRFVDVTEAAGLGDTGYGMGVAVGDYDGDGWPDVYVTNHGPDALYRNRGDGTFEDVTERSGTGHAGWSTSAAFADLDGDGDLDLYVATYLDLDPSVVCRDSTGRRDFCGPRRFPGTPDVLYRNDGDGTFTDVSRASGVAAERRRGLGVVCCDLDGDGRLDVYVANDNDPNNLWLNRGGLTFVDEALLRGVAVDGSGRSEAGMGVVACDVDGDADVDIFLTHMSGESNTLYRAASGAWDDATAAAGLLAPSLEFTGFGAVALDVELDGDPDLATVNGRVFRGPAGSAAGPDRFWRDYAQPGQLYLNDGRGRFDDATSAADPLAEPRVGRGLAAGDVDGDGDVDLLLSAIGDRARLLLNEAPRAGHWLVLRLLSGDPPRDEPGARVTVHAGEDRFLRVSGPGGSYLSSSDPRVHVGLGRHAAFDAVLVRWPDGTTERFPGGPADREVTLSRGGGR